MLRSVLIKHMISEVNKYHWFGVIAKVKARVFETYSSLKCIILNIDTYMHIKLFTEVLDTFHSQINWLNYILLANVILVYNSKECRVFTPSSFNAVDVKSFCSDKEHWFFRNRGSIKSNCTALCARSSLNAKNSFHQVQFFFCVWLWKITP